VTATVTADFREEFEAERTTWLRKRFLWFSGAVAVVAILFTIVEALWQLLGAGSAPWSDFVRREFVRLAQFVLFGGAFLLVWRRRTSLSRKALLSLVFWCIVLFGLLTLLVAPLIAQAAVVAGSTGGDEGVQFFEGVTPGQAWLGTIFLIHLLASLFIPWSARESLRPLLPLLGLGVLLSGVSALFGLGGGGAFEFVSFLILALLIPLPGVLIASWRHSRFHDRFHSRVLRRTYKEMKRELTDARRIHEALFPAPVPSGAVRFTYRYEPMRQIGGDFLYVHTFPGIGADGPDEPLSVVIIDVTGHGIPAALTVNRLYGELERLFGEEPDISPGDVLSALNNYVHYTMAGHSVYATALCLRVDPNLDVVEWASGGHPPAFLRAVDGRIERLDSTALVLGACHGADFDANQQSFRFVKGDAVIAYTDGALEARSETGRMIGLEGMQRIVATVRPDAGGDNGWAPAVLRAVDDFRFGPPADDTLIVEIYRPLRDASSRTAPKSAR